jgi:hypothetical protein
MPASSQVLTIADYAQLSNDPLVKAAYTSMLAAQTVFRDVPVVTDPTLKMTGERTLVLPSVNWAGLNEDPTVTKTAPANFEEQFFFYRNQFQADRWTMTDKNAYVNPLDYQVDMYFKSVAYEMNDAFFNNTHVVYPNRARAANQNCFVGIRERLDNPVYGMATANKVASAVDYSTISATTANALLQEIANLFFQVGSPEGDDCVIYCSETMLTKLDAGIRALGAGGGFNMVTDAYGRSVQVYKNAKVRTAGRKAPTAANTQAQIITMTETVNGASDTGSTYTSIYVVRYGMDSGFGWQMAPPQIQADAWLDNGVTRAITAEGGMGLYFPSTFAIARLYGLKIA